MTFKLAISNTSGSFHKLVIEYCIKNDIAYKLVDFAASDIVEQISDCSAVFWHHSSSDKFAVSILLALEIAGYSIFPNMRTSWSFDNKISQAIYFGATWAPSPKTYLFFDRKEALAWSKHAPLPLVWKLSTGAGSQNVQLIESRAQLERFVTRSFGRGFWTYRRWYILRWRLDQFFLGQVQFRRVVAALYRLFVLPRYIKEIGREREYFLAQEFISGNDRDVRIIVIGDKAFGIVRKNRSGDFRASASGLIETNHSLIDEKYVKRAFELNEDLQAQCVAFDFVDSASGEPLVLEICYGFTPEGYARCPGYWLKDLKWVEGPFDPYGWMVELLRDDVGRKEAALAGTVREKSISAVR